MEEENKKKNFGVSFMARIDPGVAIRNMGAQLRALDSKMRIIAQRMKIIEKNEQIIGKTLISHNKKLKELEETILMGMPAAAAPELPPGFEELPAVIEGFQATYADMQDMVSEVNEQINRNMETIDKMRQEINEMKYILDTINPVAYVTVDEVSELVGEIIEKKLRKKKV